eukprot:jgi/Botrbrau1/20267/Bobra.31_1s0052.1
MDHDTWETVGAEKHYGRESEACFVTVVNTVRATVYQGCTTGKSER